MRRFMEGLTFEEGWWNVRFRLRLVEVEVEFKPLWAMIGIHHGTCALIQH